jgi:hypothetical protein
MRLSVVREGARIGLMGALIHVTAWERTSLRRRVPCAFLRVGLGIGLLVVLFSLLGPPIGIFVFARWLAHKDPGVTVAPTPLMDYSVAQSQNALSYRGFQFQVPWPGPVHEKMGQSGPVMLSFESGQALVLFTPPNQGFFTEIAQDKSMGGDNLPLVMGDLMRLSPHDQYAAMLGTTPSSIRAFGPRRIAVRDSMILVFKGISLGPELESGVYSIDLPDRRGFQIGNPEKSPQVELEIFGDKFRAEFVCLTPKNGPRLTQAELNLIATSVHPVALASAKR